MGLHICSTSGELDGSKFGEPMPWIGIYVAAASLLCSLLMGIDAFYGFHRRKLWFPCGFFSLNAASLTLLSVATKLPVDLNNPMPRPLDQLSKLSGSVLICTAMGNFIPSLGAMDESALISNVIALGILVITVVVNIGIQMNTGVIYVFLPEHATIMSFMLFLLVTLCSTALMVSAVNKPLEHEYERAAKENSLSFLGEPYNIDGVRPRVLKLWMMTGTSGQYIVGHSTTCPASGALSIVSALILLQAAVRSLVIRSLHFCQGKSDYTWSITFVLISQAIAIGVGNIAPAIRGFYAIRFWKSCKSELINVEKYWVHKLEEWRAKPLSSSHGNRTFWKYLHLIRIQFLSGMIQGQKATVRFSKLVGPLPANWFSKLVGPLPASWFSRLSSSSHRRRPSGKTRSESDVNISNFCTFLGGDAYLLPLMVTNGREDIERWIRKGKSIQQDNLVQLLMNSQGFQNFLEQELTQSNCRTLVVVTLTSIAITIARPCMEEGTIKSLRRAANEGLRYVRLFEKFMGAINPATDRPVYPTMMMAADIFWPSIDLFDLWLDNDLTKLARTKETVEKTLEELSSIAERYVLDHNKSQNPCHWPPEEHAAKLMHMLCDAILERGFGADQIFQVVQKAIADTIGDCLKYLPEVIHYVCFSPSIESREKRIKEAAYLLGELEELGTKEGMGRYLHASGSRA